MIDDSWADAKEVSAPVETMKKKCEGHNCAEYFMVKWPTARRCDRCRREKRPYKSEDNPF